MMKIIFICAEDESPAVGTLSAFLKKHGHQVHLAFEPKQFDRAYIRNSHLAKFFSREKGNLKKIAQIKPGLIAFSCTTAHYQWAIDFARKAKRKFPQIPIIFGGVHPTLVPELVLQEDCVDFVCVGEGEEALLELLELLEQGKQEFNIRNIWYKKGEKIIANALRPLIEDLDKLPYFDKGLFYKYLPKHYFTHSYFFTSRGCPFSCSFCGNEQMRKIYSGLGKYVRRMNPQRAVEEIASVKKNFGAKYILFADDIFAMDINWLKEFIPLYKQKVGLPFTCLGHTHCLTSEIIQLLKEGGCNLFWFGVQSANEKIRREVFNRYETNEQIKQAAQVCRKAGVKFIIDQILNVPYDTHQAIKEAIYLYNQIRPAMINCYRLLHFPKAKVNQIALKAGMIKEEDISLINQGRSITYTTGVYVYAKKDFYRKYALVLTIIPLLPRRLVNKIAKSDRAIEFFGRLPIFMVPLVKVILNFKAGHGFLPIAILRMEAFFTMQFFKNRLQGFFARNELCLKKESR